MATKPRLSFGGGGNKCATCSKTVYANEQVLYDSKYYHQECFKCTKCKSRIALVNVAVISGDLYCKPCFKKVFAEKGSYNSFGDKVVSNWTKEHRKSVDQSDAHAPHATSSAEVGGKLESVAEKPRAESRAEAEAKVESKAAEPAKTEAAPAASPAAADPAPAAAESPAAAAESPAAAAPAEEAASPPAAEPAPVEATA